MRDLRWSKRVRRAAVGSCLVVVWLRVTRPVRWLRRSLLRRAAVLRSEVPEVSLNTYVDDRTVCGPTCEGMHRAVALLTELDHLTGQAEDPFKEEMARVCPSDDMIQQFPRARSDHLDLLGIRLHFNDSAPSLRRGLAELRFTDVLVVFEKWRAASTSARRLCIGWWSGLRVFLASTLLGRIPVSRRFSRWLPKLRCRCSLANGMLPGVTMAPRDGYETRMASGTSCYSHFGVVSAARSLQQSKYSSDRYEVWNHSESLRSSFAEALRECVCSYAWEPTESPYVVSLPQGKFDLGMISQASLLHLLRQGWRDMVMESHTSIRHECIDVPTIDVAPLHQFLAEATPGDKALAWRCVVAAEPSPERMAHVAGSQIQPICPWCLAQDGTTMHLMWECQSARATELRAKHNLCRADCHEFVAAATHRAAFLQNGWALAPVFLKGPDLTLEAVQICIAGLCETFKGHVPISVDGCTDRHRWQRPECAGPRC